MNYQVEALIPRALQAAETHLMKSAEQKIAYKEYDGYAASLGAAIRMSGLLPALSFYSDVHKGTGQPRRYSLLVAILHTLGENVPENQITAGRELLRRVVVDAYGKNSFKTDDNGKPVALGAPNRANLAKWQGRILNASVALKLALRSYQHTTEDNDR